MTVTDFWPPGDWKPQAAVIVLSKAPAPQPVAACRRAVP
jgi:hypothetical protein